MYIQLKGRLVSLEKPLIMGILNYTDDSFYRGSCVSDTAQVLKRVEQILVEGGDLVDVGAVSTRPGAVAIDEKIEVKRIQHITSLIMRTFPDVLLSVDTWRASVAQIAIEEGAGMINDISGGTFDEKMIETIAKLNVPFCMMHTSAPPEIMQQHTTYQNILADIFRFFGEQIEKFTQAGVRDIIIDLGFGFGKTLADNYLLLKNLAYFKQLNCPILTGISRKSMIYKLLNTTPEGALTGTIALNMVALLNGASILRVHDAAEAKQVISLYNQLKTL